MKQPTPKQLERINKVAKMAKIGTPAVAEYMFDLEDKVDSVVAEVKSTVPDFAEIIAKVKGDEGEPGIPGKDGKKGDTGPKGDKGDQGIPGIQGPQGIPGEDGMDGLDGKDGIPGTQGIPGLQGKDGSPDSPLQIAGKLNTLQGELDGDVIKGWKDLKMNVTENLAKIKGFNPTMGPSFSDLKRLEKLIGTSTGGGFGLVTVVHLDGTSITYTAASNTNVARGTALSSAITAIANGDTIYLSANTFDLGTNRLDLSKAGTVTGVSLIGSGKYSSVITSAVVQDMVVEACSNSYTANLTITATNNTGAYPWGNKTRGITNAVIENVKINGTSDGVYFKTFLTSSAEGRGLSISTNWDNVFIEHLGTFRFYDCDFTATASASVNSGHNTECVSNSNGGTVELYNCSYTATGGTINNYGILNTASVGTYVIGGRFTTSGTSAIDIFSDTPTMHVTPDTIFDSTKEIGQRITTNFEIANTGSSYSGAPARVLFTGNTNDANGGGVFRVDASAVTPSGNAAMFALNAYNSARSYMIMSSFDGADYTNMGNRVGLFIAGPSPTTGYAFIQGSGGVQIQTTGDGPSDADGTLKFGEVSSYCFESSSLGAPGSVKLGDMIGFNSGKYLFLDYGNSGNAWFTGGNVGFGGQTSPSYPVDVIGDVNMTGHYRSNAIPLQQFDHFADANNVTTGETDLYSDTVAASTLVNNGDKLVAEYGVSFTGHATANSRVRIYFGGTVIFDTTPTSIVTADFGVFNVKIIRESSTVVRCMVSQVDGVAALAPFDTYTRVTGLTLTNTNILKITGQMSGTGAASNQITAKMGYVEFKPAA